MDIKDVEKLAELARIELSGTEKESLLSDMKGILKYIEQIEELKIPARNASGIAGAGGEDIKQYNIWREDEIAAREFSKEIIIEQFPDAQDGFLKVKKIL